MNKIGVRLPDETYGYDVSEIVEFAKHAEDYDYHSVWVAELQGPNGFIILGQIASETDEIGLGTGIVNVYSRTPALLAMSVATLDQLSDGRTLLGLAASSKVTIEQWHGIEYARPLRRVRETIEIVNEAMANQRVDYDGDIFTLENYPRSYETIRDHVPIYNAALGPTNRKLTGEFADGWLPVHVPRGKFEEFVGEIRESAENAGRDPQDVTIAPYVVACVDEDGERARDHVRGLLSFYLGAMDYYAKVFREFGFAEDVEAVREAWSAGDREEAAHRVSDELLDEIAIGGTPEEGREKLREYRELGADVPIVYPPKAPRETIETTIAELGSY
ncbi:LLM class flavin-dependent oxidoreductase [Natronosalvus halobius]|uniref:LLM class flavin-dependent oxidoreductase n=1 Tax=Natronosalvus halobius TaxID=2953746 RepID=UPI0020A1D365|nr:LLM class flavin-dependent oxidoreductase [Natronosalvus halobius]USZ73610.1 LLM class flavin-dependent oxidoreductase [Natronosalvus halobius]